MIKISQDKQELLRILKELEKDFEEGKISEKNYRLLSKQYISKLENLDAANRIKNMMGQDEEESLRREKMARNMAQRNKRENEDLINRYVSNPKTKRKASSSNKNQYLLIGGVFLLAAAVLGVFFAVGALGSTNIGLPTLTVDESAFPEGGINITNDTNTTTTNTNTNTKNTDANKNNSQKNSTPNPPKPDPKPEPKPEPPVNGT
ncbi:MAG: hypothetical protein ACRC1M_08375 [Methanobacteriaceae archaeon]